MDAEEVDYGIGEETEKLINAKKDVCLKQWGCTE